MTTAPGTKTILVSAGNPYHVKIERGLLAETGKELMALTDKANSVMVIADHNVCALYGEQVEASLSKSGFLVYRHIFPNGESHKELYTWQGMLCALAENRMTRTDWVIALGGGVTGDMAGFAAATYLRGIRFMQIPTTLLAMVDSSVGGKTGVNLPMGKNLAGAFYQPSAVLCDPDALFTLPKETLLDGVAEAIKTAILGDEEMFGWFASGVYADHMEEIIARCVAIKTGYVARDEHDRGERQLLNLGHTMGHAIERLSGYEISHGRAVSMGMVIAARLALALGICDRDCLNGIEQTLHTCGLPVDSPYQPGEMLNVILSDKKRAGDCLTLVLPKRIGECVLYPVAVPELTQLFQLLEA